MGENKLKQLQSLELLFKSKGTPQRRVISPLLANLYLHFTLDVWLTKQYPSVSFVRYADDIIIHCNSKEEAEEVLRAVKGRLAEVKL
jgi:retron-type reverse transcriptase